jgi:flavin-dependent dehydrogenase
MRSCNLGPLANGGTAVVIGGGPAGVATAIALKRGAQALGHDIQVTMVEGKQFAGEYHYNQCVGVLSPPIAALLQDGLNVPFPNHLTQRVITGYVLHTDRREIVLDGNTEPSVSLRRVQFDAYMLDAARQYGIEVKSARVTDIEFRSDRVVIYTENSPLEGDVVIGAFGLDEGTAAIFSRTVGYRMPPVLNSVVTNYHPGEDIMYQLGNRIHALLPAVRGIEFGAITPKGNHLTINIAGASVDADLMDAFLGMPLIQRFLPNVHKVDRAHSGDLQYFKGRFPRGLARNFLGDRFIMVGDAAGLVRAFKGKGVTTAILTGLRAARTILEVGISAAALQSCYAANRDIIDDLPYGQAMRRFTILASRFGLMDSIFRAAEEESRLRQSLFDAVSGHGSYREVIRKSLAPASVAKIAAMLMRQVFSRSC